MRKPTALLLVLFLSLAGFVGLKLRLDGITRTKIPGSSIIYIPSGKYLRAATFGYSSFAADVIYVWAIQYYGNPVIADRFTHLRHVFSIIADLDPVWFDPYQIAALIALYDAKDLKLALEMFDLGADRNPDKWIFPFEAGHYAQLVKDFDTAKVYYKRALDIPGSPPITKRLYANAAFKTQDIGTAWETWSEVYRTAPEPEVRKIATNHLYNIKATIDIAGLKKAVETFRERYGRRPAGLEELVGRGLVAELPLDFDGKDYVYDPATGDIKTAVIPWKR